MIPKIVIVGRPNVGKSTLFNRLVGRRQALVDDQPGVTRDRREGLGKLGDLSFTLIDTAGLEEAAPQSLAGRMLAQTKAAIADADAILFVLDARAGLLPADQGFAELVRKSGKPTILVANKSEGKAGAAGALEAYALGLGTPVPVSAEHGEGLSDLYDALQSVCDARQSSEESDDREPETGADRASDPGRGGRPSECRQVDPGQPAARRGAAPHRTRGRHHPRHHICASGLAGA
jgi:GTP-binding protein